MFIKLKIFHKKIIHIISFLMNFLYYRICFFILKNGRSAENEFHFSKLRTG